MYKIITFLAFLATATSAPGYHQATSSVSFNDNHNSIHHIESAPAPAYAAFPVAAKVAVPAAPAALKHSLPAAPLYAAPAKITKIAAVPFAPAYHHHEEVYADVPAQYEFAYGIQDHHTGDMHSQQEHRDGDHVVGQYSLHEPDGTVRIVKYSDDGHGFNAVVERQGHPTEAPGYKKLVAIAAPSYHH